ncbi:altered inheritance of mitochondria [Fusarium pseudoanthophilum]|uniref:Altered inheritance of mitochondria n=1 Tax=Fusarium pseudoanthophilum TaxID=48495 RepID=A0A8H5LE55_9HYPO|nr:altered inheritance of mitochondria [Fusarium pseudoanthophilum]
MPVPPHQPRVFRWVKFNLQALLELAEKLRGRSCTCDETKAPKSGSLNWAIFITFDDGVEWVLRSPRYDTHMFSDETASKTLISEASTLRYLETHCQIPVPKVYSYSGTHDNDIGIPYILQSKASGRPLSDYRWTEPVIPPPNIRHCISQLPLSDSDRKKIMNQLGTIMSRLSKVQFDKIGSLFEDDTSGFSVGECLSPVLTWRSRDSLEAEIERGPFTEETTYLRSLISAFTAHAEELSLTPYLFFSPLPKPADYPTWDSFLAATDRRGDFIVVGDKLEGSKNRLDYCIAGQILEEMVPKLLSGSTAFTISHPDLHTGNIFVDEDLNVTCIIDWGSATTGPMTELLATPRLAGSSLPPSAALTAAFQAGLSQESPNINQDMWRKAEMNWYLSRLVRLLSGQDLPLFQRLYDLIFKTGAENPPDSRVYGWLFHQRAMTSSNKQLLSRMSEYDLTNDEMKEREINVFSGDKVERLAVARKLTLMSEMNPGFIGDRRLWRWIEEALKKPVDGT